MSSEDLHLWYAGEAGSVFVYYLTCAFSIAFIATVTISKALRRIQPQVIELPESYGENSMTVSYIVLVTTDFTFGSGCPLYAKVFMQLCGAGGKSQYFPLIASTGGRRFLQRGFTDMFLCHLPASIGSVMSVKFVVSGLKKPSTWRVSSVQLYDVGTGDLKPISATVTVTEVLDASYNSHVIAAQRKSLLQYLPCFHQWTSMFYNTVRLGAFTELVHVMCVFTSLLTLLLFSQIFYITFPRGADLTGAVNGTTESPLDTEDHESEKEFNIDTSSLVYGSLAASGCVFVLLFMIEILIRHVRYEEMKPGNGYEALNKQQKWLAKRRQKYLQPTNTGGQLLKKDSSGIEMFYMNHADFFLHPNHLLESPNVVQKLMKCDIFRFKLNDKPVPAFLSSLVQFLDDKTRNHQSELRDYDRWSFDTCSNALCTKDKHGNPALICNRSLQRPRHQALQGYSLFTRTGTSKSSDGRIMKEGAGIKVLEDFVHRDSNCNAHGAQTSPSVPMLGTGGRALYEEWQMLQKVWCRNFLRDLHLMVKHTRLSIGTEELDMVHLDMSLKQLCADITARIGTACVVQTQGKNGEFQRTPEVNLLQHHLAVEVIALVLHQIGQALLTYDRVSLADLVLQSSMLMMAIEHCADALVYFAAEGKHREYLLSVLNKEEDLHSIQLICLETCFLLVNTHRLMPWEDLKTLTYEIVPSLDVHVFARLLDFVEKHLVHEDSETLIVQRLCRQAETEGKQEVWSDLQRIDWVLTGHLLKKHVLAAWQARVRHAINHKHRFDKKYDLLPQPPKSRIVKMMEKRRQKREMSQEPAQTGAGDAVTQQSAGKQVRWQNYDEERGEGGVAQILDKSALLTHSKHLDDNIDTLQLLYDRLEKKWTSEGLKLDKPTSRYLSQSVLHPNIVTHGNDNNGTANDGENIGKIQVENFLQMKRLENLLSCFYEAVSDNLVTLLMKSLDADYHLRRLTHKQDDMWKQVMDSVLIKVDTLHEVLSGQLFDILHDVVRLEPDIDTFSQHLVTDTYQRLVKNADFLLDWSCGTEVLGMRRSEMMWEASLDPIDKFLLDLDFSSNTAHWSADENNCSLVAIPEEEESTGQQRQDITPAFEDVLSDMMSIKNGLQSVLTEEMLRDKRLQAWYIQKSRRKLDRLRDVNIYNIVDSYFMIGEGDDSRTLTKAGLYQLEYDCTGERSKPFPHCVKTLLMVLMFCTVVFSLVYVTLIGGQFTTTQLQEWTCYYLLALFVYCGVFESLRAAILAYLFT